MESYFKVVQLIRLILMTIINKKKSTQIKAIIKFSKGISSNWKTISKKIEI